jgi:hypothetical protein
VAVGHREGLRGGLKRPIKGGAGDLGVRAPVGIAAVIRAGEADRATARCDPGSGKEVSGRRARTGDWPVGSCLSAGWSRATCSDGTAGRNRGSWREEGEGKEGDGHRQVGSGSQRERERESAQRKRATMEKKREQLGRAGLRAGRRKKEE